MVSSLFLGSHKQIYLTKQLLVKVRLSGRREECLSPPRKDWPFHWWAWGDEWDGRDKLKSCAPVPCRPHHFPVPQRAAQGSTSSSDSSP